MRALGAEILDALERSPITSNDVIEDIRESVAAGELWLAFDTLCSWIYEDDLPISSAYHRRLVELSADLGSESLVADLAELVSDE